MNFNDFCSKYKLLPSRTIKIFGVGRGAFYVYEVFKNFGFTDFCFYVSDLQLVNKVRFFGNRFEVRELQELEVSNNEDFIFCSFLDPMSMESFKNSLTVNCRNRFVYQMDFFLQNYMLKVVKRPINDSLMFKKLVEKSFKMEMASINSSPSVSIVLTEKCSLNCEGCGAWVPDNPNPQTYCASSIVRDIQRYCSAFDFVHHIALQGGEPLMHKELELIVKEISKIPNLLFVDIVTNGTLLPAASLFDSLRTSGVAVVISDYGSASPRLDDVAVACYEHGVCLDFHSYVERSWIDYRNLGARNKSEGELNEMYRECTSDKFLCCQIMDGRVYRCSISNFATRLELIPNFRDDYASLEGDSDVVRSKVRDIAFRKVHLEACNFCAFGDRKTINAGIQIRRLPRNNSN